MNAITKNDAGKRSMMVFSLLAAIVSVASLVLTWHRDLSGIEIGFIVGLFCTAVSLFFSAMITPRRLFNEKSEL
jgi:hypothetical protein